MTSFAPETAGALLNTAVPVVGNTATVTYVRRVLERQIDTWQTINYIYVVDAGSKLVGVLSIKELLQAGEDQVLGDICTPDPVVVHPQVDRERVAYKALQHNIKAVPVTRADGTFLGVVDTDTILETLFAESAEDFARFAGVDPETTVDASALLTQSAWQQVRGRAPYLLLGLAGGLVAAVTVGQYEAVLEEHVMVAAFIPLVVYLADAIGSQIQIIFIRTLALSQSFSLRSYITREAIINITLGILLSVVLAVVSYFWLGELSLTILLLLAVFATSLAALVIAVTLPLTLRWLGKDPALGSGPLATICIDIISLLVYFFLASWLLL